MNKKIYSVSFYNMYFLKQKINFFQINLHLKISDVIDKVDIYIDKNYLEAKFEFSKSN